MKSFKSIVILDLESSGLPCFGGKTKITELSLVGVLVEHLRESHKMGAEIPRVLQKLNICCYPQKLIDFEATEITGLDNFLLENIPSFNEEACHMLSLFLKRMPAPVCLVAHNGMQFDFPLLKAELSAKNEALPQDALCADSLLAFRALFPHENSFSYDSPKTVSSMSKVPDKSGHIAENETPRKDVLKPDVNWERVGVSVLSENMDRSDIGETSLLQVAYSDFASTRDQQKVNETTPTQSRRPDYPPVLKRKNVDGSNLAVRKKLFKKQESLRSHKLVDLYRFLNGKEQTHGHHAENDTMALLECIVSSAPRFMEWIESNSISFTKIPNMW